MFFYLSMSTDSPCFCLLAGVGERVELLTRLVGVGRAGGSGWLVGLKFDVEDVFIKKNKSLYFFKSCSFVRLLVKGAAQYL